MDVLLSMLQDKTFLKVLVFAETKRRVSRDYGKARGELILNLPVSFLSVLKQ